MKNLLLYTLLILLVATIVSFVLGYAKLGIAAGVIFMAVAFGAANIYQLKNREYIHAHRNKRNKR